MVQVTKTYKSHNPGPTPQWFKNAMGWGYNKLLGYKAPARRRPKAKLYKQIMSGKIHQFKQKVFTNNAFFTTSATGYYAGSQVFTLNDLTNPTEYTSLFDNYRLKKIKWCIMSTQSTADEAGSGFTLTPYLGAVVDPDDNSVTGWTDFTQISQYNDFNPKKLAGMTKVKKYFTPAVNDALDAVNNPTYVKTDYAPLLDMGSPAIPHYGIKFMFKGANSTIYTFYIITTYYFQCSTRR